MFYFILFRFCLLSRLVLFSHFSNGSNMRVYSPTRAYLRCFFTLFHSDAKANRQETRGIWTMRRDDASPAVSLACIFHSQHNSRVIKYSLCEIAEYSTIVRNEIHARPGTRYTRAGYAHLNMRSHMCMLSYTSPRPLIHPSLFPSPRILNLISGIVDTPHRKNEKEENEAFRKIHSQDSRYSICFACCAGCPKNCTRSCIHVCLLVTVKSWVTISNVDNNVKCLIRSLAIPQKFLWYLQYIPCARK